MGSNAPSDGDSSLPAQSQGLKTINKKLITFSGRKKERFDFTQLLGQTNSASSSGALTGN